MKIYLLTEEQVRDIINIADFNKHLTHYDILKEFSPIELPSDEEIEKQASEAIYVPYDKDNDLYDIRFAKGAKWMKEQILNQNK